MTQKELLYYEDAVMHEESITKIINEAINKLEDEKLITFMNNELDKHNSMKEKLINQMEDIING